MFITLNSSVLVAYGGHSVWSNDNHVLLRDREVRSPPGELVNAGAPGLVWEMEAPFDGLLVNRRWGKGFVGVWWG